MQLANAYYINWINKNTTAVETVGALFITYAIFAEN